MRWMWPAGISLHSPACRTWKLADCSPQVPSNGAFRRNRTRRRLGSSLRTPTHT